MRGIAAPSLYVEVSSVGRELTAKQRAFLRAYQGEAQGNATQAARLAGYSHPGRQGHRLLKHVEIRRALEASREADAEAVIMSRRERKEALSRIARGKEEGEVRTSDRLRAIRLLARMEGDFEEVRAVGMVKEELERMLEVLEEGLTAAEYDRILEVLARAS